MPGDDTMPRRGARATLAASCLGMLTLGANGTAIMAALPTIRDDLGLSAGQLEWAINAYLIVSAVCIIPGGKAGDRVGTRRVAMAGLALFALASLVVATAWSPVALLGGRALQGLAAALAVPATLAAISAAQAPDRRAGAIGAWAGFLMLGFSLGPLIGGALTHLVGWRVIFWASGAAMLVASGGFLGGPAPAPRRRGGKLDVQGFVLLAVFMTALVSALHALPTVTHAPMDFVVLLVLAGASFVALQRVERRAPDPLIDLGLFADHGFVRAVALGSIAMACILALLLFYNLDAQSPAGLGLTPVGAGLSLLPMSGGLLIFAFAAPVLIRRFGPRATLTAGTLAIGARGGGGRRGGVVSGLGAAAARAVRDRGGAGAALRHGAAARARRPAGGAGRRRLGRHQRLHLPRRQRRRRRGRGRLCPRRPAGGDGAHRGGGAGGRVALSRTGGR